MINNIFITPYGNSKGIKGLKYAKMLAQIQLGEKLEFMNPCSASGMS